MSQCSIALEAGAAENSAAGILRPHKVPAWQIVLSLLLLYFAHAAHADVLPDHDNGPLTGIFGFPESTENSELIGRGQQAWDTSFIIASHNIDAESDGEVLRLDGETTRLAFTYRYGLADKLELGIAIPYVWHESGSLDSIIDDWHDFFGLPDGPRARREKDQLEFFYADSQAPSINMTRNANGIGDIRLLAGWQLSKTVRHSTALQFSIKLPTGDSDEFLGSGGTDLSLGLAGDMVGLWGQAGLSGFYRANVTYLGKPDQLADRYNDFVGQVSFGLGCRVHRNVDLMLQSRIRSAVYDSAIENLGETSVSLTFGVNFRVANRYRLVLSVGEDVKPDSAPDVTFQIALRYGSRK